MFIFPWLLSRMMSQPLPIQSTSKPSSSVPRSFLSIARQIHTLEGPAGFFRGLSPTLLRAFPANACALFVYEGTLRALGAEEVCRRLSFLVVAGRALIEASDKTLT
jgi:solute carrier family 25 carnitine/acylcarnitine transporter 20/29